MNQFDTIVVGAGVSGLTTARLLARAGQRVLVLGPVTGSADAPGPIAAAVG